MANIDLIKLGKTREDGTREVLIRFYVTKSFKPQFSTGVFVHDYEFELCGTGDRIREYAIIKPEPKKRDAVSMTRRNQANKVEADLSDFVGRFLKIADVTKKNDPSLFVREWFDNCMRITSSMDIEDISFKFLSDTLSEEQEQQEEARIKAEKPKFFELFEEYLKEKALSDSWVKNNRVLFRDLARYEAYVRFSFDANFTLDVDTITKETISDFRDYLRNEKTLSLSCPQHFEKVLKKYPTEIGTLRKSPKLVDRGNNSIVILMKKFKAFFNWLNKTERSKNMPFIGIEIGSEVYGTPYYLSIEERNIIAKHDFGTNKMLSEQRDIFVFQCLVGCRISDLMTFTADNVTDGILSYVPIKTKDDSPRIVRVPLIPYAQELIKKYAGIDKKGRLFPFISSQKYNDNIKKIVKACGIDRMVIVRNSVTGNNETKPISEVASSHMARRTFIGGLYEGIKDPNIIAKMSGHVEGSKAFNRYRDISDNTLKDALKNIDF